MAHKYSTFSAAFSDLSSKFGTVKQYTDWATQNAQDAYSGASNPVDKTHFGMATYAIECIANAVRQLCYLIGTDYQQSYFFESIYWAYWGNVGAGVSMDDILNAMLAAKFEELQKFIGIEDAYRVALWNAPFNADFYAALARGFQKWP